MWGKKSTTTRLLFFPKKTENLKSTSQAQSIPNFGPKKSTLKKSITLEIPTGFV